MEAHEIRIGNIAHSPNTDRFVIVEIGHINEIHNNPFHGYTEEPLTEEWLKKFGTQLEVSQDSLFQIPYLLLRDDGYMWLEFQADGHYDIFLKQKNKDGTIDSILLDMEYRYVHQLQNLYYAHKGEELKILTPV